MRLKILAVVAAAGIACAVTGCSKKPEAPPVASASSEPGGLKPADKRNPAPDFTLKDADGKEVKLSDYKGKVVLLNFWATWCGPCKFEIPWLMDFEKQYKDRGFAVLGVSMDEDGWEAVKPYVEQKQINYRVVLGNEMVGEQYGGVDSLPTTFMVDRDGKIASVHVGLAGKDDFENDIKALLD